MKDYKLSEVLAICNNHENCDDCEFRNVDGVCYFWGLPFKWIVYFQKEQNNESSNDQHSPRMG